ncbi:MAG: hypothetical protein GX614_00260 [Sandaracinaceae bacterium]|nr:hypothetical protein [Sandaracinaceae bacterium]
MKPKRDPKQAANDLVFIHSGAPDGSSLNVIRKRGDEISLGQIQRAEEGKPIHGELLQLKPYDESGRLYEVETLYEAPATAGGGPAQVTTPEFRENFRAIFGAKRKKEEPALLN